MDRGFAPDITRREGELTRSRVSAPLIKETSAGVGDYPNFYLGSVTVAGALAGLLFVSLSVAPQRMEGRRPAEHQAIAGTAYPGRLTAAAVTSGPPAAPAAAARDTRSPGRTGCSASSPGPPG